MSAHSLPVMFGVVALVLLGPTGSTPVPAERNIPLTLFEMSAVQRDMAVIPGDRTRRGGGDGGDWLLLPSTSEKLSAASPLHQKRSTYFHPSITQPIMAGLPGDRPGGRGITERVVVPLIPHTTSRIIPYPRSYKPCPYPTVTEGSKQPGCLGNMAINSPGASGSITPPLIQAGVSMCGSGQKKVGGQCRTLAGRNSAARQGSVSSILPKHA